MAENKIDFEKSLSELEKIVAQLGSGECSLDESIKLFEKGYGESLFSKKGSPRIIFICFNSY